MFVRVMVVFVIGEFLRGGLGRGRRDRGGGGGGGP